MTGAHYTAADGVPWVGAAFVEWFAFPRLSYYNHPIPHGRRTMAVSAKLIGKYEIIQEIGRGGFAVVYQARDVELDRIVALKVLRPALSDDPDFVARFKQEARAVARLQHPNIVIVYDATQIDGQLIIAMQYVEGRTLRDELQAQSLLPLDRTLAILEQIASALDYAHQRGVVHRDVKPANILLEREGDHLRVKLTDFGLARSLEASPQLTQTLSIMGTPAYMAPEQLDARKRGDITGATDVYALGVVTYEMLCGHPPFEGETLAVMRAHAFDQPPSLLESVPDLGADLDAVVLRALNKTPATRYASADSLVAAIQQARQQRQRQAQHQAALAQLVEQVQAARSAREWLQVQGLCVQIMQINRAHPEALHWMNEANAELQHENKERLEHEQHAKRYEEGEAALTAGQWQAAIEAFGEVPAGNPDFPEVQQKLAVARDELQRAQWYNEAITHAEAQRWADASRVWIRVLQGRLDYHEGDAAARLLVSTEGLLGQFDEAVANLKSTALDRDSWREALRLFDLLASAREQNDWPKVKILAEQLMTTGVNLHQPRAWLAAARRTVNLATAGGAAPSLHLPFPENVAKLLGADRLTWLADGKEMVRVSAGEFWYGDKEEENIWREFWIDKTPVTNAEYARFVAVTKRTAPDHWKRQQPPQNFLNHPVINVSWNDAVAYAKWAGKRLPTEQEWERAARGIDGRTYPWGEQEPSDKLCNFGGNRGTTPVGKYSPQGDSPCGCVDMAGNVWEWTASDYDQINKVIRGGAWDSNADSVRSISRGINTPDVRNDSLGFRCVAVGPKG